ncbi:hypothetical protein JCM8547_008949 [Rhodosporidiobolus lusitaniae]
MSRIRNPFKRQDSFAAASSSSAPALPAQGMAETPAEEVELKGVYSTGSDGAGHNGQHHASADEKEKEDPAMLDLSQLDSKDRLANGKERPIESAEDWSSRLLSSRDDDVPVHTFRMYALSLAMTAFAGVLGQIYYFRPTSLQVSSLFILVVSFILAKTWETLLPKADKGAFWRFLNPGPFNIKEHSCVLIMSSTAFSSANAISLLAANELYYDLYPNFGLCIFTLIGSQFFGYGLAGLFRSFLVFPSFAVWPQVVPTVQLFDVLHRDTDVAAQKKRFRFFYIIAACIFVWEFFPEFIAPTLTGVSIICLARRDSAWVSRIFGGSYPNQGFGMFSLCFDWVYISGCAPLYTPLSAQLSLYGGTAICILFTSIAFAKNMWSAQNFPFMAQDLYYENGTVYDQTLILNPDYSLNETALEEQGVPWYTTSMAIYYLGCNLAIGATITHIICWHRHQVVDAWKSFRSRSYTDPHYLKMRVYKEVPMWVYGAIVLGSFFIAIATTYTGDSHMPWYATIVAFVVAAVLFPFICLFPAITGWQIGVSNLVLMLGAAVIPGNAQANGWFQLFAGNASTQGIALASDLKIAQYVKLPPRTTLWVQSVGTVVGGLIQVGIMKQILHAQRDILLDSQGNNLWSGQNVQSFNSQSVTWGALAKQMFSPGSTYEMIPMAVLVGLLVPIPFYLLHLKFPKLRLNLMITPLVCYGIGFLNAGINSQNFMAMCLGAFFMGYVRVYHATWFRKYCFLLSAALDAGSQVYVFITTFALSGGAGTTQYMPNWALNPVNYPDYCLAY